MNGLEDVSLRLDQRPVFRRCSTCVRFNKVCTHVSEPEKDDPTRAYVKIYTGHSLDDAGWEPAIASLDTGTEKEWISSDTLKRFKNPEIVPLSPPETYKSFQGLKYQATRAVVVSWHTDKHRKTRKGLFRIVDDGPFDVVIGSLTLFREDIYIFNEAALLFFHRKAKDGEEVRMQRTLAEQTAEVRQSTAARGINQEQLHRQQRAELESTSHRSDYANNMYGASRSAYDSPAGLQTAQRNDAYAFNTGRHRTGYGYDPANPGMLPPSQQGVAYSSYTALSSPTNSTTAVTQRSSNPPNVPSPYHCDVPISATANGTSSSASHSVLSQETQRWTCSKCYNRNDVARNLNKCDMCSEIRRSSS